MRPAGLLYIMKGTKEYKRGDGAGASCDEHGKVVHF
jgi:hypothetical protein